MSRNLTDKARLLIETGSNIEKEAYVNLDKWIEYGLAINSLEKMQKLIDFPGGHRPKNILLIGSSNNGKTMILNRFSDLNPQYLISGEDHHVIPCVKIQAPFKPNPKLLYNKILDSVLFPHKPHQSLEVKERQVFRLLKKIKCKVLVIDEIHHVFASSANQQREFLNCIKHLSNELCISIIAAGTLDAFHVITSEAQMANRFIPINLEKWKLSREYLQLLATLESTLPLEEASNLHQESMALEILRLSEGLIGEITTIVKEAFVYCLRHKKKYIDLEVLKLIDYVTPSMRKRLTMIG